MERIRCIDIADINCWIVYLMPFSEQDRADYDKVDQFQKACIKEKIFGMGWKMDDFDEKFGTRMTKEKKECYLEQYQNKGWKISNRALNSYFKIKKGDFVITRLKNGNYYVGRVSSEGAIYLNKPNDEIYGCLSWGAEVDRWVEYSHDGELPSEIVGRFSQQLHSTIQRIEPYRQRLLVIALYEKKSDNKEFNIPKLRIGVNNFVRSLNYMELEDLVAVYIYDKHHDQGYKLLPSSCKISQQNIEFRFVASGKKDITCQVKNQKTIEIDHFVEKNVYEKIYVFSGMWNDSDVDELRKKYKEYPHISIIKPSELFKTLEHNDIFTNDFYDFGNKLLLADELNLSEFDVCDKPKKENACKISGDKEFVSFVAKDGLFYSAEFCALILSWHIMDDHIKEKEIIQNILKKLN